MDGDPPGQELATKRGADGKPLRAPGGQPLLDYAALYPAGARWPDGTPIPPGTPILRMLDAKREIIASDLTALITGLHLGNFPADAKDPVFRPNAAEPDRTEPYREFTSRAASGRCGGCTTRSRTARCSAGGRCRRRPRNPSQEIIDGRQGSLKNDFGEPARARQLQSVTDGGHAGGLVPLDALQLSSFGNSCMV